MVGSMGFRAIGALAVAAALAYSHYKVYSYGKNVVETKYQKIIAEERTRQAEANEAANEAARIRERDFRIRTESETKRLLELQKEAIEDEFASRPSLSSSSVRRIRRATGEAEAGQASGVSE